MDKYLPVQRVGPTDFPEIEAYLAGQKHFLEEVDEIYMGVTLSPYMVSNALLRLCYPFEASDGRIMQPHSFQSMISTACYLYYCDLITEKGFYQILHREPFTGYYNFPPQIYVPRGVDEQTPAMFSSIAEAAVIKALILGRNPDAKFILVQGKWNGVPHMGHTLGFKNIYENFGFKYKIKQKDLYVIAACDTNHDIELTGGTPFLTTFWRMALISYIPGVSMVCSSGDFPSLAEADDYWRGQYYMLDPDFLAIEEDDPLKDRKLASAKELDIEPIMHRREGMYTTVLEGEEAKLKKLTQFTELSSRNIMNGTVSDWVIERVMARLLTVRRVNEEQCRMIREQMGIEALDWDEE